MELVNLMKHSLRILNMATGQVDEYAGASAPATVHVESKLLEVTGEYNIYEDLYGEVQNLPDPRPGLVYVVPLIVKERAKLAGRTDILSPSSGPTAVRFKDGPRKGQIDYVVSLSA